jgi:hypothetical protein
VSRSIAIAAALAAGVAAAAGGSGTAGAKPLPPPGPPPDPSRGETYDGRDRPRESTGRQAALLLPRTILAFPRMALEIVRIPLVYVLDYTETRDEHGRNRGAPMTMRGWSPIITFVGGEVPAVGAKVYARDLFGPGLAYATISAIASTHLVGGRIAVEPNPLLSFGAGGMLRATHRTDEPFFGLAGTVPYDADGDDLIRRVQVDALDVSVHAAMRPGGGRGEWRFTGLGGVGIRRFEPGERGEPVDPSASPDFEDANFLRGGVRVKRIGPFDVSRDLWGVDVTTGLTYTHGVVDDESRYLTGELEIACGFPLDGGRAFVARLFVGDQHSWGDDPPSFYDRFDLGGAKTHRGFRQRRFRGGAAVLGQLDYRFPILMQLDGLVFVENGGAFEEHFDDFDPEGLRTSIGVGLRVAWRTRSLRFLAGWGFGDGAHFSLDLDVGD